MKTTDSKDQEIKIGDYIFINDFAGSVSDERQPRQVVLKINGRDHSDTFSVEYSCGWPAACHPDIISGKNGWWFSLQNHYTFKIPQRLIDARDKNAIKLFVQLAGYDLDINNIELFDEANDDER